MTKASVCLAVYNENKGIQRVLDYLHKNLSLIDDVIIISDACKDGTDQIIQCWIDYHSPIPVVFVKRKDRLGRASAIRLCMKFSKNDLIIVLSGDINPMPDAFATLLSYFNDENVGAVTGRPLILNSERTIADCLNHIMWGSHNRSCEIATMEKRFFHINGNVFAFRKSNLHGYEKYEGIAEDAMIGYLIAYDGHKVLWAKDVQYLMRYPSSLNGWLLIRRRCCWGRIDLAKKVGLIDSPFYELSYSEYFVNVLKATKGKLKFLLALPVGMILEMLCRFYYQFKYIKLSDREKVFSKLMEPSKETKW